MKSLTLCVTSQTDLSNKPAARARVFLGKLTVSHPVQKFPSFYGIRRLIIILQELAICPAPEPDQSCSHPPNLSNTRCHIILPTAPKSSKGPHFIRFAHQNTREHLFSLVPPAQYVRHAPPLLCS